MANEEKILEMLESIQADMQAMKADIASLKKNETDGKTDPPQKTTDDWEIWEQMRHLLTKEEGDSLAEVMEEIERKKAAMYA